MPYGGAEQFALPFMDTGVAESLGETPLQSYPDAALSNTPTPSYAAAAQQARTATFAHQAYVRTPPVVVPAPKITPCLTIPTNGYIASRRLREPAPPWAARTSTLTNETIIVPPIPGAYTLGAATFTCDWESGGRVTFAYMTDVMRVRTGLEFRQGEWDTPRRTYELSAQMDDGQMRDLRAALYRNLAAGSQFTIALPWEGLSIVQNTVGQNFVVVSRAGYSDWLSFPAGIRVLIIGPDGTAQLAVVQSLPSGMTTTGPDQITLDVTMGLAAVPGAMIMPLEPVVLDPAQGFGEYPNNLAVWQLKATSTINDDSIMGPLGGSVGSGPINIVNNLPVWDYQLNPSPGSGGGLLQSGVDSHAETEDVGGPPGYGSVQVVSDVLRQINLLLSNDSRRQWVKAFWGQVRGRLLPFYLPTWKDDLLVQSGNPGQSIITVYGPPNTGVGDYMQYNDVIHQWLMLQLTNGSVQYAQVTAAGNNGNGTANIVISGVISGTIAHLSYLELVRFDSDELTFEWSGNQAKVSIMARTVLQ